MLKYNQRHRNGAVAVLQSGTLPKIHNGTVAVRPRENSRAKTAEYRTIYGIVAVRLFPKLIQKSGLALWPHCPERTLAQKIILITAILPLSLDRVTPAHRLLG